MRALAIALAAAALACFGAGTGRAANEPATKPPRFCSGCNFESGKLEGADFSRSAYVAADFTGADLRGASFRQARLIAMNFLNADLRGVAFDGAQCVACNFLGAKLDGATFSGVQMMAGNFKGFSALVADAQLRQLLSGCMACNFSGGNFAGRDLSQTSLISVDFSQADLRGTRFDGAILCWDSIEDNKRQVRCDAMRDAQTSGASFTGVRVCDDPLEPSTCTPADAEMLRQNTGSPLSGAALP